MPQIFLAFKDMDDCVSRPLIGIIGVITTGAARSAVFQCTRCGDLLLGQHTGNFGWTVPGKAQAENLLDHWGGFFVHDKASILAFEIAIDRLTCDRLATHAFAAENCLDFLARISHHPFVEDITQRGKIIVALCAVHSIVDSDKANTPLRENHIRIHSHLEIVSPQSRHILDNDRSDFPGFNVRKHGLKTGSLEVRTGVSIVRVPLEIGKTILFCVAFQNTLLVRDGITLALQFIFMG